MPEATGLASSVETRTSLTTCVASLTLLLWESAKKGPASLIFFCGSQQGPIWGYALGAPYLHRGPGLRRPDT